MTLVDAVRRGDKAAERLLYAWLYPVAWRAVRSRTRNSTLPAEDIVQVALERIHRSLMRGIFAGDCSLSTWVTVIANTAVTDAYRESYREEEGLDAYSAVVCSSVDAERLLGMRSELRSVAARLGHMKAPYARVIAAIGVGMTLAETSAQTRATLAATQMRLRRAREALRRTSRLDSRLTTLRTSADSDPLGLPDLAVLSECA